MAYVMIMVINVINSVRVVVTANENLKVCKFVAIVGLSWDKTLQCAYPDELLFL